MRIGHIFVFFGYSLFIVYLFGTGEVTRFISPRFMWLTYLSGISLSLFYIALSMRDISHKEVKPFWKEALKGLILIYPVLLFFLVNPSDITSTNTPAVREIPINKKTQKKDVNFALPVDEDGYVELNLFELWLLAKNYPNLAEKYKFKTFGMVSDISEEYAIINRFFMTCCAADATAVEIDAVMNNDQGIKKGDWIKIWGKIIIRGHVIIIPEKINVVQKPYDSYITRWSEEPPFNP